MAPTPLIAGNWKMNAGGRDGVALAQGVLDGARKGGLRCSLLICPPAVLIAEVAKLAGASSVAVGGQDCHAKEAGAHTGEISARMLLEAGASFVIVGHSERRTDHGETDALVQAKAEAAQRVGLTTIICIGETQVERESGETLSVLASQLKGSVPEGAVATNTVIAYEPVWAIGSGRTPAVEEVAEAHRFIRGDLKGKVADSNMVRILYGGSVKADNAYSLLAVPDVNGALIGGASLDPDAFLDIARACP